MYITVEVIKFKSSIFKGRWWVPNFTKKFNMICYFSPAQMLQETGNWLSNSEKVVSYYFSINSFGIFVAAWFGLVSGNKFFKKSPMCNQVQSIIYFRSALSETCGMCFAFVLSRMQSCFHAFETNLFQALSVSISRQKITENSHQPICASHTCTHAHTNTHVRARARNLRRLSKRGKVWRVRQLIQFLPYISYRVNDVDRQPGRYAMTNRTISFPSNAIFYVSFQKEHLHTRTQHACYQVNLADCRRRRRRRFLSIVCDVK